MDVDYYVLLFQLVNGNGESLENAVKLVVKAPGYVIQSSLSQQGLKVPANFLNPKKKNANYKTVQVSS